jgi:hypothetical protein
MRHLTRREVSVNPLAKRELFDEMISDSRDRLAGLKASAELEEKYLQDLIRRRSELTSVREIPADSDIAPGGCPNENGAVIHEDQEGIAGHTVPEAVKAVLEKRGKPMRARDVVLALEAAGFKTESKRGLLPSVLSALGRREDLFKKVRRGTYKLITAAQ